MPTLVRLYHRFSVQCAVMIPEGLLREQKQRSGRVWNFSSLQQNPHIVSMVQDLLREKRFKTWEEAAKYVEQTLNKPSPEPHKNVHANDKEGTPS